MGGFKGRQLPNAATRCRHEARRVHCGGRLYHLPSRSDMDYTVRNAESPAAGDSFIELPPPAWSGRKIRAKFTLGEEDRGDGLPLRVAP